MKIFSTISLLTIAGIVLIGAVNRPANAAMSEGFYLIQVCDLL